MVSFDDCQGNPGALAFMSEAYFGGGISTALKAEAAFKRVIDAGIRGVGLYLLWNDCCGRDTAFALEVMLHYDIDKIKRHVNLKEDRGIPFDREEK